MTIHEVCTCDVCGSKVTKDEKLDDWWIIGTLCDALTADEFVPLHCCSAPCLAKFAQGIIIET